MKLIIKQKISFLDSYDVYDEEGNIVYKVKGEPSIGHQLRIYDAEDKEVGLLKEKNATLFREYKMIIGDKEVGEINEKFSVAKPTLELNCKDWKITGDVFGWDYTVVNSNDNPVAVIKTVHLKLTDTYEIDVKKPDALYCLMITIAIDAATSDLIHS